MAYEDVKKYFRSEAHYNKHCKQMGVDGILDAMCLYERGDKCSHPQNKDGDCYWSKCPKKTAESEDES
jgi:hypothetical protein